MDFQPRLGVVTRSLALASSDLIHFMLVAGCVFLVSNVVQFVLVMTGCVFLVGDVVQFVLVASPGVCSW
jgi:hypothetical protein